jgi:hypothetical protein
VVALNDINIHTKLLKVKVKDKIVPLTEHHTMKVGRMEVSSLTDGKKLKSMNLGWP